MATRHYLGIAEPAEGGWSISFPAFPGTVSAGETFDALMANARDALASVIEAMHEEGKPLPDSFDGSLGASGYHTADYREPHIVVFTMDIGGKAVRINVTMDEALVARLDRFAGRARTSRSALLAQGARMVLAADADWVREG